jgi:hypothetical protein
MRLDRDWYQAASREIRAELLELKQKKENILKDQFEEKFWKSKDGKVITALKEKYNTSCNNPILRFDIINYRIASENSKVYTIPSDTMIQDQLRLKSIHADDANNLLKFVRDTFVGKLEKAYAK